MFFFGHERYVVRKIKTAQKEIFLTFDDGPDPDLTPQVLDLLRETKAHASFFVIGEKAQAHPEILQRILREGHSVLSHSLDHRYDLYFRGKDSLKTWLQKSLLQLEQQTGVKQSVFRPPAGVLTPPLIQAARELKIPLVLWNHRFYDTALPWTENRAAKNAATLVPGDIVLLHDRQRKQNRTLFLKTLRKYLQEVQQRGYLCASLSNSILQNEVQDVQHSK